MKHFLPEPGDLPALSQKALDDVITKHDMYLRGQTGGARAVLQYRNLSALSFHGNDLSQADFTGCLCVETDFSSGNFTSSSFFACDLRNAHFEDANLTRADFRGAYLGGANLTRANLHGADLREGKIMKPGEAGVLIDRKRSGGIGAKTVLTGARLTNCNMREIQAKNADFTDADLSNVNLLDSDLNGVNFTDANLSSTNLTGADLSFVSMRGTIVAGVVMDDTEQQGLDLSDSVRDQDMGSRLENLGKTLHELLQEHTLWVSTAGRKGRQLDLSGYDLRDVIDLHRYPMTAIYAQGANFLSMNLEEAEIQSANLDRSDFRDAHLKNADLRASSLKYAKLTRANLEGAQLCPLYFDRPDGSKRSQRCDLSGADLRYTHLVNTDLRECILMGADLRKAVLRGCDLRRADLTGALLKGAQFIDVKLDDAVIDLAGL